MLDGPKTRAAMEKFKVGLPADPELEKLTAEANKKGLVILNKNNKNYIVYPPAQLIFDMSGNQLDPKSLSSLSPNAKIAEGISIGPALTFIKNFGKATVEKGIDALKTAGKWIKNICQVILLSKMIFYMNLL